MRIAFIVLQIFMLSFAQKISVKAVDHSSNYISITQKIIDDKCTQLSPVFDNSHKEIVVFLYNSHKKFRSNSGLGNHINGVMISSQNVIFLKTPELTGQTVEDYEKLLTHELIHLFHNQMVSVSLFPDWFSEGLAVYFSNSLKLREKIQISKILLNKHSPGLKQLRNIDISKNYKANNEYLLSASVIEFLINTYDVAIIKNILSETKKEKDFYTAISKVTNLDLYLMNFYWKQYLKDKYSSYYLMDLQYILWLFLPFLFIFSIIVKLFQNQTIINRWKYERFEEEINSIFSDNFVLSE